MNNENPPQDNINIWLPDFDEENFNYFNKLIENGKYKPVTSDNEARNPLADRDKAYTNMIRSYTQYYSLKNDINLKLRKKFFCFAFSLLSFLIVGMIAVAIIVSILVENAIVIGVGIVSSVSASATSFMVLPRIIGLYLFPNDEDKYISDMICQMRIADEHRFDGNRNLSTNNSQTNVLIETKDDGTGNQEN